MASSMPIYSLQGDSLIAQAHDHGLTGGEGSEADQGGGQPGPATDQ